MAASLAVTTAVVLLLVMVWSMLGGGSPTVDALVAAGAKVDDAVAEGAWWRLVSAGALHAGPIHLAMNAGMLAFAIVAWVRLGRSREDEGWSRASVAVALMVLTSTAGFLTSFVVRAGPSVGASAAAHGLLAAVVMGVWLQRAALPAAARRVAPLALTAVFVLVIAVSSSARGVDHAAHIGGSIAGLALAPLVDRPGRARKLVAMVATLLVILALAAALDA